MDRFRVLPSYHYEDSNDGILVKSVGKALRDYKIEGQCVQNGTPTPEVPIEVECCGERTINAFNPEEVIAKYSSGDTYIINNYTCVAIQLKPNTTYYMKTFNPTGTEGYFYMNTVEIVNSGIATCISINDDSQKAYPRGFEKAITTNDLGLLYIGCYALGGTDERDRILRENQIQVVEGSYTAATAPGYEPYGYKVPVIVGGKNLTNPKTYNIYLDEPLRKVGDYADYVDFKNGKVVRNIYRKMLSELTFSINGSQYTNGTCRTTFMQGVDFPSLNYNIAPVSNSFNGVKKITVKANTISFNDSYSYLYIYLSSSAVGLGTVTETTVSAEIGTAIKNYLTGYEIDIIYVLGESVEESIDLPDILTHKGINVISIGTTIQPSATTYQYYKGGK